MFSFLCLEGTVQFYPTEGSALSRIAAIICHWRKSSYISLTQGSNIHQWWGKRRVGRVGAVTMTSLFRQCTGIQPGLGMKVTDWNAKVVPVLLWINTVGFIFLSCWENIAYKCKQGGNEVKGCLCPLTIFTFGSDVISSLCFSTWPHTWNPNGVTWNV